jgi:predicted ATPase
MGYATVSESARTIIAERLARGLSPRPAPDEFGREILREDILKYAAKPPSSEWVFFDRGVVDALGMMHEVSPLPGEELNGMLARYPFHKVAFILPPWQAIYVNDAERDQSFTEGVAVHDKLAEWYRACGYTLCEVPRLPVSQRARHVLGVLAESCA